MKVRHVPGEVRRPRWYWIFIWFPVRRWLTTREREVFQYIYDLAVHDISLSHSAHSFNPLREDGDCLTCDMRDEAQEMVKACDRKGAGFRKGHVFWPLVIHGWTKETLRQVLR